MGVALEVERWEINNDLLKFLTTTTITTQLPTTYLTQTRTPTTQITVPPNTATILTLT